MDDLALIFLASAPIILWVLLAWILVSMDRITRSEP